MEDYIVIYAVVPKHIYETKLLTPEEKLIAERIIYLCKKEGYCWITNKRLSEMYNITIETASRHIKKLEKIGLIKCIYDHNDKNTRRVIQLVDDIWANWSIRDKSNNQENIDYSINHNNKYNNRNKYKYRVKKLDKYILNPGGTISFGAENATFFYQPEDFISGRDMYYIDTRNLSKECALFVTTCLQKITDKYSYNYGLFPKLLKEETIKLPITEDEQPDWKYMENFIESLPYGNII